MNPYYYIKLLFIVITLNQFNAILCAQVCKGIPQFMQKLGFDPVRSAMSSQENRQRGILLIELQDPKNTSGKRLKQYQDPSWLIPGYVGSITTGRSGDIYVLPKANVNTLYNSPKNQNTIYRIESSSGILSAWINLPMKRLPDQQNATGLTSAYYDCESDALIVSSIAGSTQLEEIGKVYTVQVKDISYKPILENIDVLGVLTARLNNEKRLFYGLTRRSEVWSIALDNSNNPIGNSRKEISVEGLGPRGDDKIRKMRMDTQGTLIMYGTPHYYNLTAPVIRQETVYTFQYDINKNTWKLIGMQ